MRQGTKNPRSLKERNYADRTIDIKEYLSVFLGEKSSDKICEMQLNEILLNSVPNTWIRHSYVQWFDCETITLKELNMFERMEILEYIHEGVIEPCYKKNNIEDANHAGHSRKIRGESGLSTTYFDMSDISDKLIKSYVDHPKYRSKLTCLIHGSGYLSDEFKVLGDFGSMHYKYRPTKDRGQDPKKRINLTEIKRTVLDLRMQLMDIIRSRDPN